MENMSLLFTAKIEKRDYRPIISHKPNYNNSIHRF